MSGLVPGKGNLAGLIGGHLGFENIGKPFSKEIFLIESHIAGTSYVEDMDKMCEKLGKGLRLNFFREPENEFDKLAIVIKNDEGCKLGYVPKSNNEIISRLMDAGKLIYGIVESKEYQGNWLKIEIQIYLKD